MDEQDLDVSGPVIPPSFAAPTVAPMLSEDHISNLSSDTEPPRKRQRTQDLASHSSLGQPLQDSDNNQNGLEDSMTNLNDMPVRDEVYYNLGADCVIRVEDTLFRVHRFLLARDSSAFQDMFSLPSGGEGDSMVQEGFSDENPIVLFGESVEDFRSLLSVLYALPHELAAYNSASADISRLLTIASLTNKYHFNSTAGWAIDAIYAVTSGLHGPPIHPLADLSRASSTTLTRVLEVALCCGHAKLADFVVESWSNRILARRIGPRAAMQVADKYDIRPLRGVAYYMQLMEGGLDFLTSAVVPPEGASPTAAFSPSTTSSSATVSAECLDQDEEDDAAIPITYTQGVRLLTGFRSLVLLWEQLAKAPPTFARPDGCTYHVHGCLATFAAVWGEAARSERTLRFGSADVVGRLRSMEDTLRTDADLCCALSPGCKRAAMAAVRAVVKEVQEGLAERFVDLAPSRVG